jgi:hypothetical protein
MNTRINTKGLFLAITGICLAGCQNFKPSDIYPQMPPNSSFERHITTVWGQTKVIYTTGPEVKK